MSRSHQLVTGGRGTSDPVAQEPEREPAGAGALGEPLVGKGKQQPVPAGQVPRQPEEEGESLTCSELMERLVGCGRFTREEAENLRRLPDEQLAMILQDTLNTMVTADAEGR